MDEKEFQAVLKISASKRYEYFIKKVVDREEVWGLFNQGWAMSNDDNGNILIPFWPRKEFASHHVTDEWRLYNPQSINLYEFIEKWLPGIKKDDYKPAIFLNNQGSAVVEVDQLLYDLNQEIKKY